jgi:hypothetical protein
MLFIILLSAMIPAVDALLFAMHMPPEHLPDFIFCFMILCSHQSYNYHHVISIYLLLVYSLLIIVQLWAYDSNAFNHKCSMHTIDTHACIFEFLAHGLPMW